MRRGQNATDGPVGVRIAVGVHQCAPTAAIGVRPAVGVAPARYGPRTGGCSPGRSRLTAAVGVREAVGVCFVRLYADGQAVGVYFLVFNYFDINIECI